MTPQADFITQGTRDIIAWVWGTGLAQQNLAFFAPAPERIGISG
jgi:hypothetical protein